ncbi:MAG: hypothetical protein IMF01_09605 [Proteobacteria bacterium]|nr:hypothetical protein [Pseudomonadota bacterium]
MELDITAYLKNKNEDIIAHGLQIKPSIGDEIISEMGTFEVVEVLHFLEGDCHNISVWCKRAKRQK